MIGLFQSFDDGDGYQYSDLIGVYEKESDIPEYLKNPNPTEEEIENFIDICRNRSGRIVSREEAIKLLTPRYFSLGEYPDYDNEEDLEDVEPIYEGYLYVKELTINPKLEEIVRFQPW